MATNTQVRIDFVEANAVSRASFSSVYPVVGKMVSKLPVNSANDATVDISNLANPRVIFIQSTLPVKIDLKHASGLVTSLMGDILMYGLEQDDATDKIVSLAISRPTPVAPPPSDPPSDPSDPSGGTPGEAPDTPPEEGEKDAIVDIKVYGV